ncbi:hypothetical protein [Sphingobacterium tabacisoli]|uniref:Uncharacterized protein n=1 Tax=Sphingobacterium tabacisoli TaxID=2044855 RepID=A0ABW5L3H0_9SPHI|nr:hypothetical protein [Sphingobacterium tabacisoli]
MKKYSLDQKGVNEFLNDLRSCSISTQLHEQALILVGLPFWLPMRFILNKEEISYVESLDPDFSLDLADHIVYALNYGLYITLDRQPAPTDGTARGRDSVKVTAFEASQQRSSRTSAISGMEARLTIRIYHEIP